MEMNLILDDLLLVTILVLSAETMKPLNKFYTSLAAQRPHTIKADICISLARGWQEMLGNNALTITNSSI